MQQSIIVFGGKGFVGGHLVDYYIDRGYDVKVIDNGVTGDYINPQATYFDSDIVTMSTEQLIEIMAHSEVVFHLAATARVQPSFENPQRYFYNNVGSVVNVLDALRRLKYKNKFIYMSTSSVYGVPNKYHGNSEYNLLNPGSPYALSKVQCEQIIEWYRLQYQLDNIIARPFNIYGPRLSNQNGYQTVLQKFLTLYKEGKPLTVWGDGEQRRDFTHVDDVIHGLDLIFNKGSEPIYNIASNQPISVNQIIEAFPWQYPVEHLPKVIEPNLTRGNIGLIKMLGYNPQGNVIKWLQQQIIM